MLGQMCGFKNATYSRSYSITISGFINRRISYRYLVNNYYYLQLIRYGNNIAYVN